MDDATKSAKPKAKAWKDMKATEKVGGGCAFFVLGFIGLIILIAIWPVEKKTPEAAKAAVLEYYSGIVKAAAPCDEASKGARRGLEQVANGKITKVEAYRLVNIARVACDESRAKQFSLIAPNGLAPEAQTGMDKANVACSSSLTAQISGYEAALKVLDGDERASQVLKVTANFDLAQKEAIACVAGTSAVGVQVGATADELVKAAKQ